MGVFMYKTQNGMALEELSQLFVSVGNIHSCLTRSARNGNLKLPEMKLKCACSGNPFLILVPNSGTASPRYQEGRVPCLFQGKI